MNLKVLPALACALLLTGCADKSPPLPPVQKLKFVRCEVPASAMTCDAAPAKPPGPADQIADEAAGRFLVDLETAGEDCRDKLAAAAEILRKCEVMK